MRRKCQYEDPLWTLEFAAAHLGISVRSLRALIDTRAIHACYPYAQNVREMRVVRTEILRYADEMRSGEQVPVRPEASYHTQGPAYDPRLRHGHPRSLARDAAALYKGVDVLLTTPSR